jgi:ferredoxin
METLTPHARIAQKIDEQDPHQAPRGPEGGIHEAFLRHLELLYTPEEAEIVQHLDLPMSFRSTQDVAETSGKPLNVVEEVLTDLHKRNHLMGAGKMYCLPVIPHIVNIQQFYPDVKPGDLEAAQLYQDYFIKGGFYRRYESSDKGTPVGRVIPVGRAIDVEQKVLPAEEAHDYIMNHTKEELALVPCPCRTRTEKMGMRECKDAFPIGACIMMGGVAQHFESLGMGKPVTKEQAIAYFDEMVELGLVGHTINAEFGDMLICLCCGCCCSQVRGRTQWDNPNALSPSNFAPRPADDCIRCETCTDRCFFDAITFDDETDQMYVDVDKCIGCGLCTLACTQESLRLHRYERSKPFETSQQLMRTIARENRE